jgi:AraC-like DNA-binding protein
MKPALEHLPLSSEESFAVRYFDYDYYPTPWHFHPEYEIVLVTESTGKRFIGDDVRDFKPGDLAFIGPNLPHLYRNDSQYYEKQSSLRACSIVIHFLERSLGDGFLSLPESKPVQLLLSRSRNGLQVTKKTQQVVSELMHKICEAHGMKRWMLLLDILHILSESKDLQAISKTQVQGINAVESHRMNGVLDFVLKNFHREISLQEVASLVNLSENSFSRYFSKRTRKPFISFLNEVRLSHACKLLIENQKSVSLISFECGFGNLSNFNRQFRKVYGTNPLTFRKQFIG